MYENTGRLYYIYTMYENTGRPHPFSLAPPPLSSPPAEDVHVYVNLMLDM